MAKIKRNPVAEKIADLFVENYDLKSGKDVHEALKDVFGPIFERLINAELDAHLGYEKSSPEPKSTDNRRNGFTTRISVSGCTFSLLGIFIAKSLASTSLIL